MKVIVDNKIPFIQDAIRRIADEVVFASGKDFTPALVKDADALIIRTRTLCNRALLHGSRVQFIATATIGFDHIDTDYCRRAGIFWTNAPGCNSASVAQYLHSALLVLQQQRGIDLSRATLGIVGVGNVGTRVAEVARKLGMRVLLNDPPRAHRETAHPFLPLSTLAGECDILTFHTPLAKEGEYKTLHLADDAFFRSLKPGTVIINTARGEVIDTPALLRAMDAGTVSDAIIDVWEGEPHPHPTLLSRALLATPHIAGYSADGKANATRMSLDALCRHFHRSAHYHIEAPPPPQPCITAPTLADAYLQMYDPRRDSDALKLRPDTFEQLREHYPLRREETAYRLSATPAR